MTQIRQLDPNTEHGVSLLLRQGAEHIPSNVDLWPRLEQALASNRQQVEPGYIKGAIQTFFSSSVPHSFWGRSAVVIVLSAALLLSAFAFARPLIFSWLGDSGLKTIALQNGTLINQQVTVHGVTLQIEQGYADAARTALTMNINSSGRSGTAIPQLNTMVLVDTQGHVYPAIGSTQVQKQGLIEFAPLTLDELGASQSLTLIVQTMFLSGDIGASVTGPWQITFQLHPQAGRSVTLSVAPETHGGIAIQPLRMDIAPTGARLLIRLSGFRADTSRFSLTDFALHGDDIVGCPPGAGYCVTTSVVSDGALLQLRGSDGQTLMPTWVGTADAITSDVAAIPSANQPVGQTGSIVLEVLFLTPLHAAHGIAHLTIDLVRYTTVNASSSTPEQVANGPWVFDLALP